MNHLPWIGANYQAGIDGQKIAIFGFSHWGRPDRADFSTWVIETWVLEKDGIAFFNRVRRYFGFDDPRQFWNSVLFANTLPSSVGDGDKRYANGTPEQVAAVPGRITDILRAHKPDKALLFSRKAWPLWPAFDFPPDDDRFLLVDEAGEVPFGAYATGDGRCFAYNFLHPQYAPIEAATRLVKEVLAHDTTGL